MKITGTGSLEPAPWVRAAECLRELGRPGEAEALLREAFAVLAAPGPELTALWVALSLEDLGRSPDETLDVLAGADGAPIVLDLEVLPSSRHRSQAWRFTTEAPPEGWEAPGFDDSSWDVGAGGFGGTPTFHGDRVVGTNWATRDLWLRRTFTTSRHRFLRPQLLAVIDDAAEVFINGVEVARGDMPSVGYRLIPLGDPTVLVEGTNTIAVSCRERSSNLNQHVDVGIIEPLDEQVWARRTLAAQGAIRINCTGMKYRDTGGRTWIADRFFNDGDIQRVSHRPMGIETDEIANTEDDALYQNSRWFSPSFSSPGYRVPLPPGRYAVSLHFAESAAIFDRPRSRVFDIALEGREVLTNYDINATVGFATPDVQSFTVEVDDGALDIGFGHVIENPSIAAIEIVPSGAR